MNTKVQLAVLSSLLLTQGVLGRVIYGPDHRKEVSEATPFEQKLAASAASMIHAKEIKKNPVKPGTLELTQKTLREWLESQVSEKSRTENLFSEKVIEAAQAGVTFCEGEKFVDQPNPSMCSGFLIAPDLIVTAGHCVEVPGFCEDYRWVFDFKVNPENNSAGLDIKEENVYECKKVLSNALAMPFGLDYAIVQLNKKVKNRGPLEIRNDSLIENGSPLVVIGSPSGLPLKVAGGANVRDNIHPNYFSANLDTFQGNSGSAVFNAVTGVVEGILVRGEEDFVANQDKMCIEANKCADSGCRGESITRMTAIPEVGIQRALNKAAFEGNMKVLNSLLKLNTWVDFYGKDGQSALMKAIQGEKLDAVKTLIGKGADVNLQDADGNSPLHHLAGKLSSKTEDILKELVSRGASLEAQNAAGETALKIASRSNNKKGVEILLKYGGQKLATGN
ncbi:MAG: ankyrin repeat domain-containing protein [Bacteriovoracia bacterium]